MVDGKQHTIAWHDKTVNDEFLHWLQTIYASDRIGKVKATRGYRHKYLGMILDFTSKGSLKLDVTNYLKSIIDEFPVELIGVTKCPWNENLFKTDSSAKKLNKEKARIFDTLVMKCMFMYAC
jgi:hypothetical protein